MRWFGRASVEKRSYHGLLTPVHLNFKGRFDDAETTKGGVHKWVYLNSWMVYDGKFLNKMDMMWGHPQFLGNLKWLINDIEWLPGSLEKVGCRHGHMATWWPPHQCLHDGLILSPHEIRNEGPQPPNSNGPCWKHWKTWGNNFGVPHFPKPSNGSWFWLVLTENFDSNCCISFIQDEIDYWKLQPTRRHESAQLPLHWRCQSRCRWKNTDYKSKTNVLQLKTTNRSRNRFSNIREHASSQNRNPQSSKIPTWHLAK